MSQSSQTNKLGAEEKVTSKAHTLQAYTPHPAYKPSGVDWLGAIPMHWEVKRLKYLATVNDEALPETTDPEMEITYVDIGNVDSVKGITGTEDLVFGDAPSRARRIVRQGDVIISTVRTYLKAIARIEPTDVNLIVSTGFAVVRPRRLDDAFVAYALGSPYFVERVVAHSTGVSYPAINASELACLDIAFPPLPEQRAIAAFLDRETARIDAMVSRKERLIELLQEKRTALITRAVTRGLDSDALMKDSGIEWLREIPDHWEVKPLMRVVTFQRGHDLPSDLREEGDVPVISSSGVSATHSKAIARAPGVVTGRYGTIGNFYLVNEDYWPLNTTLYSINLHGNEPRFLQYMLTHMSPLFLLHAYKAAVPGVDRNDIHELHTAVPPIIEQHVIANYLAQETERLDSLIARVREAIERIRELRLALISAAVTGRIDVREEAGCT